MLHDLGWLKRIKLLDSLGNLINPATNEKLDELKTKLQSIYEAVDGLEVTTDNINIEAGQINLNTDELENKIQSINNQLDVLLSTRASEATIQLILDAIGTNSGNNLLLELQTISSNINTLNTNTAKENTLIQVRDYLDTVETKLQSIIDKLDVNLSTRASEVTLGNVKTNLDDVKIKLDTLTNKDYSTQTTLLLVKSNLDDIKSKLDTLNNKDFSTQTTLVAIKNDLDNIYTRIDVSLSTRASETTLSSVKTNLDDIKTKLDTLNTKDFATQTTLNLIKTTLDNIYTRFDVSLSTRASETTLSLIKTKTDNLDVLLSSRLSESTYTGRTGEVQASPTQYTILGRLKDLWDKLNDLFTNGTGKLKIWDGTNQVGIDTQNAIYVSGKSAIGSLPVSNPVSISGIDKNGLKRAFLTDAYGRLYVSGANPTAKSLTISYDVVANIPGSTKGSWIKALYYTVPTNYDLYAIQFISESADTRMSARVSKFISLGTYNIGTQSFVDGSSYTLPIFATSIEAEVTTVIGGTNNIILTVTYTNQDGVLGRTGTITIPKNLPVGTKVPMVFQTGDYGCIDITSISRDLANTGIIQIDGTIELGYTNLPVAFTTYNIPLAKETVIINAGETLALDFSVNAASNVERIIKLVCLLSPQ